MAVAGYGLMTLADGATRLGIRSETTSFGRGIALGVDVPGVQPAIAVLTLPEAKALINGLAQAIRSLD